MSSAPISTETNYWENFVVTDEDLEFINNHLFELESPQTTVELVSALVNSRITKEKNSITKKKQELGRLYLPKDSYQLNDSVLFSTANWQSAKVVSIRDGVNPEYSPFKVIDVEFQNGDKRSFASEFQDHSLNSPQDMMAGLKHLDPEFVIEHYGVSLTGKLQDVLVHDNDLVLTAGAWFPRALLVDINIGHLNLAEAVLDMAGGEPITTPALMSQLDLPDDVNRDLLEFSLNFALQEDPRFDEVGPSGEVLWFLERLEPENVRTVPMHLQYSGDPVDRSMFDVQMIRTEIQLDDEYSPKDSSTSYKLDEVQLVLTYPHWRAGSLPLSNRTDALFPIALESPRIKFQFIDSESNTPFPGWVVRPYKYVVGLRDWYLVNNIIPGSIITIHKKNSAGDVVINANKKRPNKEWIRTALVGADEEVVLALLKQQISTSYEERMATAIPDVDAMDRVWNLTGKQKPGIEQTILRIARELTKLNPQGHIHALELYAAANVLRRIPLEVVFYYLANHKAFSHVGDLYYRLIDGPEQE